MVNNTPYVRKKISSTLIALSAASMLLPLLLTISPLLFNLQAVQASSSSYPISYQTTKPAGGYTSCTSGEVWLTFDAQGYYNPAGGGDGNVNSGKFQVTNSSGEILISGDMKSGDYNNSTGSGGRLTIVQPNFDNAPKGCSSNPNLVILTSCSSSDGNLIRFSSLGSEDFFAQFSGPVKCSLVGNTNTTQLQPSPMTGTTTTTQTSMSFKTTQLAYGNLNIPSRASASLTFDAQGTASSSDPTEARITNGTFQVTGVVDGSIVSGTFTNETRGGVLSMIGTVDVVHNCPTNPCVLEKGTQFGIITGCSVNSVPSSISMFYTDSGIDFGDFNGAVECSSHGDTTHSSMAGSTQDREIGNRDSDGDGIPDSSDRCAHNSNQRCYKEGDTSNTTQQQSSSSSNRTGNQTRQ
jgi:hypothetical protein